jgi:hypothetical protein
MKLKLQFTFLLLVLLQTSGFGANRFSVASGNWNATTTWSETSGGASGASAPVAGDDVFIEGGFTITTTAPTACLNLNIASGSTLVVGGFSSTVSGATSIFGTLRHNNVTGTKIYTGLVTVNIGGTWDNTGNSAIDFRGGITNSGTFNAGTGAQLFTTNAQALSGNITIPSVTVTTIALTNNGNLTVSTALSGTGALINVAAGTLSIGGTSGITTLTATAVGNTVNYNGAAQTVKAVTYSNLILSGSGSKSIATSITVNNNLTVSSGVVLAPNTANLISNATKLVLNGGAYSTGGYNETMGTLTLNDNSVIALGATNHTIVLAASDATTWASGKTLTITGWTGVFGSSGRIFIGTSAVGLTAAQLSQIKFQVGAENRDATILATGEVVPAFCSFAGNTQFGTTQSICYNTELVLASNIGGVFFSAVPVDNFVAVNVIQGLQYRITTTTASRNFVKRLTLFDGSNTSVALATTNSTAANTVAAINWTATFTGVLYVVFNTANCQTSNLTDNITVSYIGGSNTVDSQNAAGIDSWIGHVYNFSNSAVYPPNATDSFSNYLGYFTQANTVSGSTKSFSQNYYTSTSQATCFPIMAGGTSQTFYTDSFVVRYRMQTTSAAYPAGCYFVNVTGDDGVRLYIDGTLVFDAWLQQSPTNYNNVMVYLTGTSELVLEYYERINQNVSNFSIVLLLPATINTLNTISPAGPLNRCASATTFLDGKTVAAQGNNSIAPVLYQWQVSNDNANWTDISGATLEDYTVPGTLPAVSTQIFYRRNVKGSTSNSAACVYSSASVSITTNPNLSPTITTAATPAVIEPVCQSASAQTSSMAYIATTANPTTYSIDWNAAANTAGLADQGSTAYTFVAGGGTLSSIVITANTPGGTYTGTMTIATAGGCSSTQTVTLTVNAVTVGGVVSGGTSICSESTSGVLTLSGHTGSVVKWQSSVSPFSVWTDIANTTTTLTSGPLTATTQFRAVLQSGVCLTVPSTPTTVTVNSLPNNTLTGFVASTICAGDSPLLTFDADDTTFSSPYSITYRNDVTLNQYTVSIPSASVFSFTSGDNPISSVGYTLVSISNAACTRTASFGNAVANLIVRPIPTAGISGTTSVCVGDSSPHIDFTNPQAVAITITYTINGGADQTIDVVANGTAPSPSISTMANGSFVYDIKSVTYLDAPNCSNSTITGKTATVTVNPTPTLGSATQSIFACDNSKATIKLTGLLPNTASTISYTIAGDAPQTVSVPADALGVGYFDTRVLTVLPNDNGKILTITGVNTASCVITGLAINVTLNVQSNSGSIKLEGNVISGSTTFSELSTAHFSIDAIAGAVEYNWLFPPAWIVTAGDKTNAITVTTGAYDDTDITVSVTASNSSCPTSVTVTLSAIPPPAPVPSAIVAVSCNLLGSVTFNNLPIGNWTLAKIKGSVSTDVFGSGNSPFTVNNLTAGDYTFKITTARGSAVSGTITVPDMPSTTWNGGASWSNGLPNDPAKKVVLDASGTLSGLIEGCTCEINGSKNIVFDAAGVLKLENDLKVDATGSLTFLNGASLVQTNGVANSGVIHYRRTTSAVQDFDYVYWSSPVAGQTLGALSPLSDKYWSWGVDNWTAASASDVMTKGQGYIARVPRYTSPQNVEFVGVPFNGDVTVPSKGDTKGNLVGNPYPCAVDAVKFIDANGNFMSTETLYFWTHVGNRTLNGAGTQYVYSSNDYASFNRTGGLKAVNGGSRPNGTIGAGQSFFVIGKGSGNLLFTNDMRIDVSGSNSQFFKQANTKKMVSVKRDRVWLNLTNDGGAFKQLLLGYITGASNGFDKAFDGLTFNANAYVDFYSINDSKKYAIQGRGLPFDLEDKVPLGYKTTIAGTFQIGIDEVDGGLVNQEIYLEDKNTNSIHDLTKSSYSFTTAIGEFKDRFVLRYTDTKLGIVDAVTKGKGVVVSVKNSQIKINSFDNTISSIKVYDLKGSLLYEKDKLDKNEFCIDHLNSSDQFMIVMIQLEDGKWISEEIIFHD